MQCLSYIASTLSQLPYDVQEEPLFLIYTINRTISLAGVALSDMLEQVGEREREREQRLYVTAPSNGSLSLSLSFSTCSSR